MLWSFIIISLTVCQTTSLSVFMGWASRFIRAVPVYSTNISMLPCSKASKQTGGPGQTEALIHRVIGVGLDQLGIELTQNIDLSKVGGAYTMVLSPLPVLEGAEETDPLPLPEEPQAARERDSTAAVRAQVIFFRFS